MSVLALLFSVGLVAGAIDAIAGGGGLISLPVLLTTGMPPHVAFGTNKLQATLGTFIAARRYHRHGLFSLQKISYALWLGLLGAVAGAILGQLITNQLLKQIIPLILFIILIYALFSPRYGNEDVSPRMREGLFFIFFAPLLGFYDGFFGPGTGAFWVFLFSFFLGQNLMRATAYTKVFNLNSSLIATLCFAVGHNIDYRVAFIMALGQFFGARIGSHLAIKLGTALIRPLFFGMCFVTIVLLFYRTYGDNILIKQHGFLSAMLFLVIFLIMCVLFYYRNYYRPKIIISALSPAAYDV